MNTGRRKQCVFAFLGTLCALLGHRPAAAAPDEETYKLAKQWLTDSLHGRWTEDVFQALAKEHSPALRERAVVLHSLPKEVGDAIYNWSHYGLSPEQGARLLQELKASPGAWTATDELPMAPQWSLAEHRITWIVKSLEQWLLEPGGIRGNHSASMGISPHSGVSRGSLALYLKTKMEIFTQREFYWFSNTFTTVDFPGLSPDYDLARNQRHNVKSFCNKLYGYRNSFKNLPKDDRLFADSMTAVFIFTGLYDDIELMSAENRYLLTKTIGDFFTELNSIGVNYKIIFCTDFIVGGPPPRRWFGYVSKVSDFPSFHFPSFQMPSSLSNGNVSLEGSESFFSYLKNTFDRCYPGRKKDDWFLSEYMKPDTIIGSDFFRDYCISGGIGVGKDVPERSLRDAFNIQHIMEPLCPHLVGQRRGPGP